MSFHRYLAVRLTSLLICVSVAGCLNQTNNVPELRQAERGLTTHVDTPDVSANAPPVSQMISLDQIKDDPELIGLLNYEFDFNFAIDDDYKNADWFTIEPAVPYDESRGMGLVVSSCCTAGSSELFTSHRRGKPASSHRICAKRFG